MTWSGKGMDSVATTSKGSPRSTAPSSARALSVTPASISRTMDGLNPGWTRRR